jgi:hypothetical protein
VKAHNEHYTPNLFIKDLNLWNGATKTETAEDL